MIWSFAFLLHFINLRNLQDGGILVLLRKDEHIKYICIDLFTKPDLYQLLSAEVFYFFK